MNSGFRVHLVGRIAALEKLRLSYKKKEREYIDHLDAENISAEDDEINTMLASQCNSSAAYTHDMKVELENLLIMFDLQHPSTGDAVSHLSDFVSAFIRSCNRLPSIDDVETFKVESAAGYIRACIRSSETVAQLNTCLEMVINMQKLFGSNAQVNGWVDSLSLTIKNKMEADRVPA